MTVEEYKKQVVRALKSAGMYHRGLTLQITTLATALMTLEKATTQVAALEEVTVLETTRYGSKLAPHPAFKIQRDAQDQVTRQLKQLGLTQSALSQETGADEDPLIEMTQKLLNVK